MPRAKTPKNGNSENKQATRSLLAPAVETVSNSSVINLEAEIRRRAYELYEQRGCTPGHENDDWFVAEREVAARYQHQGV
jgi:hypothetical protein